MTLRSRLHVTKDEAVSDHGMVAANHPLATEAGLEMLKQGGNAVDAAVATAFVSMVVEPMMTCIGGCGFMLVHMAAEGKSVVVEFPPRAPMVATADVYQLEDSAIEEIGIQNVRGAENIFGYRSASVPGSVAGFCLAHERYGSLPLEQVLEPAIHHAEEGFEIDWHTFYQIASEIDRIVRFREFSSIMLNKGFPPKIGDRLVQRDLAQILRRVAREGRDAFYKGEIASAIDEDMRANDGLLSKEDMQRYEARIVEPLKLDYRGYEVLSATAPNGGITELETLSILNSFDMGSLEHNDVQYLHLFIEAARHAFADRYSHLGDPDYVPVPMKGLLAPAYGASIAAGIDRRSASLEDSGDLQPWLAYAQDPIHDPWQFDDSPRPKSAFEPSGLTPSTSTTHLGVVDRDRNMVSCTHTVASSSAVVCPGTGIQFASGMVWFNPAPGRANSIDGFKRPLVNMGPLIVLRDGKPFLSIGAPGGRKIISALAQIVMNVVDHGMGVQAAIAAPRVDCSAMDTLFDDRLDGPTIEALSSLGHRMVEGENNYLQHAFSRPVGVSVNPETGRLHGGADVLRRAEARGL